MFWCNLEILGESFVHIILVSLEAALIRISRHVQ